jgi:hypothetical protein
MKHPGERIRILEVQAGPYTPAGGAGVPQPGGPCATKFSFGHVWVTLAVLAQHCL